MMKWMFSGIIFIAVIFGILNGRIGDVSVAAIDSSSKAVELIIKLLGNMCLWMGIMKVAEESGLTNKISRLLSPITMLLFKGLKKDSKALNIISMNITANILGLGNAATPLGIEAMKQIQKEDNINQGEASRNMIMLVVINTASIQLLPTTIAMLRLGYGSKNPLDIYPAIIVSSIIALLSGIFMLNICSYIYNNIKNKNKK